MKMHTKLRVRAERALPSAMIDLFTCIPDARRPSGKLSGVSSKYLSSFFICSSLCAPKMSVNMQNELCQISNCTKETTDDDGGARITAHRFLYTCHWINGGKPSPEFPCIVLLLFVGSFFEAKRRVSYMDGCTFRRRTLSLVDNCHIHLWESNDREKNFHICSIDLWNLCGCLLSENSRLKERNRCSLRFSRSSSAMLCCATLPHLYRNEVGSDTLGE